MTVPAIEVTALTKVYDKLTNPGLRGLFRREYVPQPAVRGISLRVDPGELVALVGPNGAGKSTLIKMLVGTLMPTSGSASVLGRDPQTQRRVLARLISVIFGQESQLYPDLPLRLNLRYTARVYRVPKDEIDSRIERMVEVLGLGDLMDKRVGALSLGQRMRGDIAASLLHQPRLIFLDEPTIGLDFEVQETLRAFIREVNREFDTTILLTSHSADDIAIANRVVVMNKGNIAWDGSMQKLQARAERHVTIRVKPAIWGFPPIAGVEPTQDEDGWGVYELDTVMSGLTVNQFVKLLDGCGLQVGTVTAAPLSKILLEIYRG